MIHKQNSHFNWKPTKIESIREGIWTIEDLLYLNECNELIEQSEAAGFTLSKFVDEGRNNQEVLMNCPAIAQNLFFRLNSSISISETELKQKNVQGDDLLEFYRYQVGEFVVPHCDAPKELSSKVFSQFTLIIYLNSEMNGGETTFPDYSMSIQPKTGRAILFLHSLLHASSTINSGIKYILRANVASSILQ